MFAQKSTRLLEAVVFGNSVVVVGGGGVVVVVTVVVGGCVVTGATVVTGGAAVVLPTESKSLLEVVYINIIMNISTSTISNVYPKYQSFGLCIYILIA